ncbi:DUF4089 domain-containing protein [Acetobacter conturbans]|uniref:DUF4089 domain-containing protein n=1 Tax=Acetobacter conturbans TaxID=1737472 RepID=A0ABX0K6N4_9PROT|nr:DUF4089 domain-containing protein [Acetobacter conturbans]NHN89602.1 DUF4089 domain-containing protein [Acetobacter conturbans]
MTAPQPFPTHEDVQGLARQLNLDVAPEHLPGIIENMRILKQYSDLVYAFPLSDHCVPAFGYVP